MASTPNTLQRRATVRYYTRMNPDRMFPLLVILAREQIQEVVKESVKQAASESFKASQALFFESFSSFASNAMRPLGAPDAASISTTKTPLHTWLTMPDSSSVSRPVIQGRRSALTA